MPNIVPAARYYPKLSEVITVDDLPEFLSFVQDGLNSIFDKVHYKNLQYSKSVNGDSAFYSLEIVAKKLKIPLPYDMALVLNPDITGNDDTISSFPVTLEYQWEILAFLKTFNLDNFSFSLEEFYGIGLKVFRISDDEVLAHILNYFVEPDDAETTKFEQFVEDFNLYKNGIPEYDNIDDLTLPTELSVSNLVNEVNGLGIQNKKFSLLLFGLYILDTDLEITRTRLQQFYNIVVPDGIENYLKKLLIPRAKASLSLSTGIEFPDTILRPVTPQGVVIENTKSMFVFAEAQLLFDTEAGIGYQLELGGSLYPAPGFAEIGKTGILLQIDTLKLDLSKKTNIPEADADGRPEDFTGVYARAISVTLPSKWFHDDAVQGTATTTLRIGGYDLLIGTGGLSGTIALETVPSVVTTSAYYFEDKFDIDFPIKVLHKNAITNVVETVQVSNLANLKTYLYPSNGSIPPCPIKFPISLKEKPLTTGIVKTFNSLSEYQKYLNSFPNDNIIGDTTPTLWKKIGSANGGFRVGFQKFDIAFKQNKVVSSSIEGQLEIKNFVHPTTNEPVKINIHGHLSDDGDFNLTASAAPPYPIKFPDVFTYTIKSLELGKEDDDFYIGTSGTLQFEGFLRDTLKLGPIEIERLRIYSDGSIEFIGGSVQLIEPIVLPLGPVEITVSAIHYGSHQKEVNGVMRKFNYFGFDGGVSIDPLGIEVRGDGVKYYYCVDDLDDKPHPYLHIQTLFLDLTIPAKSGSLAQINGWVTIPEPGISKEYAGGVMLELPKAKLAGEANLRLYPKYPAFIVDCELEPTIPIPLGNFAIYGFRGLLGYRYVAEKEAIGMVSGVNTWYEYYKAPKKGINIDKFSKPDKTANYSTPISIGAGVTMGTNGDDGHAFSLKAMALLSVPSLFMIDGKAAVLKKRLGLDDTKDPPFFAFVAVGDDSLELGFGADYKLPDNGKILTVYADVQAGFFFKNQKPWYINIGTNINPVTGRILDLINLKSYVMLSAKGIEAGARGEFNFNRTYLRVIKIKAHAFVEVGGKVSFERPQIGGYLMAGVSIDAKVLFVKMQIQASIMFGVEAPRPFLIYGKFYFKVKVRIKVCGIRITIFKFSGNLEVVWNINKNIDRSPINPLYVRLDEIATPDIQQLELVQGISMLTNEPFSLAYLGGTAPGALVSTSKILEYIIPLDTYIDIKTEKGLLPGDVNNPNDPIRKLLGGVNNPAKEYEDLIPPVTSVKGRSIRQVKHQYTIDNLEIKFWNTTKNAWDDYHPYEALYPNDSNVSSLKVGQFQKIDGKYNAIRLMATTPFSYTEQGQPGWNVPEQYGVTASTLFCQGELIRHKCADFISKSLNSRYYCGDVNTPLFSNGVSFQLITENVNSDYATIVDESNGFNFSKSLSFNNWNGMEILLPEPSIMMRLKLSNGGQGVKVKFYSILQNEFTDTLPNVVYGNPDPLATNQNEPYELLLSESELADEIRYNFNYDDAGGWKPVDTNWRPLTRIVIEPIFDTTIAQQITNLTEQIELTEYENELINMGISEGEVISTANLQQELQDLLCELDGHSSGFINKYQKTIEGKYHYSKEFTEIDQNVIYSIGTIDGKGLITKLNTDGSIIWEREYILEWISDPALFRRIIKISDGGEKYHYVILVTTPDNVYLLSINPETGEQGWFNFVDWRVSSYYLHVDIVSSQNTEEFYLTVSDKLSSIFRINGFTGEIINNRELDLGANNIDFLTMQGLCEDNQGVTLIGKYRIHNNENIQSVLFKLSHDLLILESVMFDDNVSVLHDVKALNHKRLLSGYNSQQDCVFVLLVDGTGIYNAYNIPNTEKHNSFIQLCQEGFYILLNDNNNDNGRIMLMDYNFQILWNKEIHLSSGSNGIRNFTFNQVTKKFTFNCYNHIEGSLVVYANKNLQTCLTTILDNPQLYQTTTVVSNISSSAQIRTNIRVVDNSTISNTIISDIKEYCPSVGCGEEDKELCELYSAIKIINENYLANPSSVSETEFNALSNYFVEILSIVGSFNPTYKLVEYLSIELKDIDKFIHERNLQNYYAAWNAVQSILSYLNEKGNCVCECKPNEFTLIHQVCWLSIQDYEYNINIPSIEAITADAEETIRGITDYIQPIWRPNTSYYIRFKLKDKVDNGLGLEEKSYAYGFTTSGPLGYFHTEEKSTYGDIKLKLNDRLLKEDNHYYIVGNQGLLNEDESLYLSNTNGFILEDTTGFLKDAITKAFIHHPNTTDRIKVVAHPDKYSLTSLKQYIDYNRSYPNADGNLLSAKPLFYNDETEEENDTTTQVHLFFSKAYVTHFFRKWDSYKTDNNIAGRLKIVIKDPAEGTEIVNPPYLDYDPEDTEYTFIPQTTLEWIPEQTPQVPFAINHYLNMYNSPNCIGNITVIKPASEHVVVFPKHLKPNKLYTAIVNNLYDINQNGNFEDTVAINEIREIHRFVFKTSRYKDFNDQINSFYLQSDYNGVTQSREAIFMIEKAFTTDEVNCCYITISNWLNDENNQLPLTGFDENTITNLMTRYQHPYDRVFDGILGLNPLDDAISTEVNIVKDLNTNAVIALIVRNPEPFNNPKYRKEILSDTIQVFTNGILNDNYKVMHSKDYSQAIIMNTTKNITENITLKFKYKLYEDVQLPGNPPNPGDHPVFNYPVKREASLTINLLNQL